MLTLCPNITPVTMGCSSSSETKHERISIPPSTSILLGSLSNSHIPGTKALLTTSKLPPNLLKYSIEPPAKRGLQDFILVDPPIFIKWLPGGSAKSRPTGHRPGRPPHTDCEPSWQKVPLSLYDGRRRGRPPRPVCLIPWSHRPKDIGVAVLRTTIPALRQTQFPELSLSDFRIIPTCACPAAIG